MFRIILILLMPFLLNAEMKCEAGKCGSADNSMAKVVPKKINTSTVTNTKVTRNTKATVEQLFNVTTVEVKTVTRATKQVNYGYIVADESRMVEVTSWFSGYVEILHVDTLYQKVSKGQALASVYSPEVYKAKQDYLNTLKFNHNKAAAMSRSAKSKLVLLGVSQKEISAVRNNATINRLTTIYAPSSGWIFEKKINQGSFINAKKSLFKIIDLSKVWLEAKLFQNQLTTLDTLTDFKVVVKSIDTPFEAKKELLYPMINPKEATATLRLSIDNSKEQLKPGMYAKLHSKMKSTSKLVIPRTAAMRKSGIWYVFLATEFKGEYEPLAIELKPLDNKHYEVTKGLVEGDVLVNNALFMMDSDAQINSVY